MSSPEQLLAANGKAIADLTKSLNAVVDQLSKTRASNHPNASQVFGAPWARQGEDPLTSRGFSFIKMLCLASGDINPDDAKVEMDAHNKLHKSFVQTPGQAGYVYKGQGVQGAPRGKFLAPLASSFMHDGLHPHS